MASSIQNLLELLGEPEGIVLDHLGNPIGKAPLYGSPLDPGDPLTPLSPSDPGFFGRGAAPPSTAPTKTTGGSEDDSFFLEIMGNTTDQQRMANIVDPLRQYLSMVEAMDNLKEDKLRLVYDEVWRNGQNAGLKPEDIASAINQLLDGPENWRDRVFEATGHIVLEPNPVVTDVLTDTFGEPFNNWWVPNKHGVAPTQSELYDENNILPNDTTDFVNRGGGGGSKSTAVYVKPDPEVVKDAIRSKLKLLVGKADESRVEDLTAIYFRDHREAWDRRFAAAKSDLDISVVEDLDPMQSVLTTIRTYGDYRSLHATRPSDVEEDEWVSSAIANARRSGIEGQDATERGLVGASSGDIQVSATPFLVQQGQANRVPTFLQNVQRTSQEIGNFLR